MSTKIKINKEKVLKICLVIISIPFVPIIIKFIFNLGVYFGIFLRNMYNFVAFC